MQVSLFILEVLSSLAGRTSGDGHLLTTMCMLMLAVFCQILVDEHDGSWHYHDMLGFVCEQGSQMQAGFRG